MGGGGEEIKSKAVYNELSVNPDCVRRQTGSSFLNIIRFFGPDVSPHPEPLPPLLGLLDLHRGARPFGKANPQSKVFWDKLFSGLLSDILFRPIGSKTCF